MTKDSEENKKIINEVKSEFSTQISTLNDGVENRVKETVKNEISEFSGPVLENGKKKYFLNQFFYPFFLYIFFHMKLTLFCNNILVFCDFVSSSSHVFFIFHFLLISFQLCTFDFYILILLRTDLP